MRYTGIFIAKVNNFVVETGEDDSAACRAARTGENDDGRGRAISHYRPTGSAPIREIEALRRAGSLYRRQLSPERRGTMQFREITPRAIVYKAIPNDRSGLPASDVHVAV